MAGLKNEYTDVKGIEHKVEHLTVFDGDDGDDSRRERIVEELYHALTRCGKSASV